jgi:hypothetical protein
MGAIHNDRLFFYPRNGLTSLRWIKLGPDFEFRHPGCRIAGIGSVRWFHRLTLRYIMVWPLSAVIFFGMAQILFTCPTVSMKVQHWLDDDDVPESEYEGITCPACARLHFINRRTGRLLGHDKE